MLTNQYYKNYLSKIISVLDCLLQVVVSCNLWLLERLHTMKKAYHVGMFLQKQSDHRTYTIAMNKN